MSEPRPGLFLVFEGVEGAGKSTQLTLLSRRLRRLGHPVLSVREPGGSPVGEAIRRVVLDPELDPVPETELLLMLAARAEFVRRVVEPALERGDIVLADRYELSTFAYQGLARELGLERVRQMNAWATGGRKADATFLLLLDAAEAARRLEGTRPDRMESQGEAFHSAVDSAYRRLAGNEADVVAIDGRGEPDTVADRIWSELAGRWPGRFLGREPGEAETFGVGPGEKEETGSGISDPVEDA